MRIWHDYSWGSPSPVTVNNEPSTTQQHFKDEVDVNHIIDRYTATGELTHVQGAPGLYADVSTAEEYQDLMNNLLAVTRAFEALPDDQRQRYGTPEAWMAAALDKSVEDGILDQGDSDALSASMEASQPPVKPAAEPSGEDG